MNRILYLHGFASGPSSKKARFFCDYLRKAGFAVEIPSLDGGDFERLTLTGQLDVLRAAANGGPVSLIGSSMGGYLAALYAARHANARRMVLLAPAFGFARRWQERLGDAGLRDWRSRGWLEVFHYAHDRQTRLGWQLMQDATQYEEMPDFGQPALIFHGAQDDVVPAAASQAFVASHPNAKLEILSSGHELVDQLDYMAPRVAAFLLEESA